MQRTNAKRKGECKSGQTHSTVLRSTRACLTRLLACARFLGLIRYNWQSPGLCRNLISRTYVPRTHYLHHLIYRTRIVVTCISRSREYSVFLSLAGTDLSVGCIKTAAFHGRGQRRVSAHAWHAALVNLNRTACGLCASHCAVSVPADERGGTFACTAFYSV